MPSLTTEQVTIIRSGLDASAYKAGADIIAAANDQIAASGAPVVETQARTTRALVDAGGAFDRYRRGVDANYQTIQQFARVQDAASRAVDSGRATMAQANAVLDAYREKFGLVTAQQAAFAAGQDRVVASIVAQRKAMQDAADVQTTVNRYAGVQSTPTPDQHGARQEELEAYGAALDQLRAKYNPIFAASRQYENQLNEINRAERLGAISAIEAADALDRLNKSFADQAGTAKALELANVTEQARAAAAALEELKIRQMDAAGASRTAATSQAAYNARSGAMQTNPLYGDDYDKRQADLDAYGAGLDQLRAKYSPLFAASKSYENQLNEIITAEKLGAISAVEAANALDRLNKGFADQTGTAKALELTQVAEQARAAAAALEELKIRQMDAADATRTASTSQAAYNARSGAMQSNPLYGDDYNKRQEDLNTYGAGLDQLRAKYNPVFAASKQYESDLGDIDKAEKLGAISAVEGAAARDRLNKTFADTTGTAKALGLVEDDAAHSAGRLGGAHAGVTRELIVMGHEVLTGNYTRLGGSMLVLVERVDALQTALKTAVFAAMNPFALAGIAVVGTMTLLATAAETTNRRVGTLANQLSLVRTDFAATAAEAEAAARHLAETSFVSTADARAGVNAVYGQGNFTGSQQQAEQIALVNARLSRQLGETAVNAQRAGQIVADPAGVLAELLKDHPQLTAFNQILVDQVRHIQEMGHQGDALNLAFEALQRATANERDAVTPLSQAWLDLEKSFSSAGKSGRSFAEELGGPIVDALAGTLRGVTAVVGALKQLNEASTHVGGPSIAQLYAFSIPALSPFAAGGYLGGLLGSHSGTTASTPTQGAGAPRGIRNNNPLNLTYLPGQGATGSDGRFGVYGTMQQGIDANAAQLLRYQDTYGLNTVSGIVNRWAPAGENDPASYAAQVSKEMGIAADARIDLHDKTVMNSLIAAMSHVENGPGSPNPFTLTGNAMTGAVAAGPTDAQVAAAGAPLAQRSVEAQRQTAQADIKTAEAALNLPNLDAAHVVEYGQALDEARKRLFDTVTASDALARSITIQTSNQDRLASAWQSGGVAAGQVTARIQAEGEALQHYAPDTAQYAAEVDRLTAAHLREAAATQHAEISRQISQNNDQLETIRAETAAIGMDSDARDIMLAGLRAEQELRSKGIPLTDEYAQKQIESAKAVAAANDNQQHQKSLYDEFANTASQSLNSVGAAFTQMLTSNQNDAMRWQNLMTSIVQQVIQEFLKLAVINPLLNELFPGSSHRSSIFDIGGAGGVAGGVSSGGALTPGSTSGGGDTDLAGGLGGSLGTIGRLGNLISNNWNGSWLQSLWTNTLTTTGLANGIDAPIAIGLSDLNASGAGMFGLVGPVHGGGVIGADAQVSRRVTDMSIFNRAPRYHSGLMPDEIPAILQRGEGVFTPAQMAMMRAPSNDRGTGGGVTIHNWNIRTPDVGGFARSQTQVAAIAARAIGKSSNRLAS